MELDIYQQVKKSVKTLLNLNLDHYKDEQMRRRLDSWLVRCGAQSWDEYFLRLRKDTKELLRFRDYLTINVSAFFRDPERWESVRTQIIPELIKYNRVNHPGSELKIWSAGCSIGAEPYTLSIMMDELPTRVLYSVLATDFDQGALLKSKNHGPYTVEEIQNLTPTQRSAYLETNTPPFYVKEHLAKKIEFRQHNLLADNFPTNMDLIVCRNVVIYFTGETKDMLYRKFQAALRPGGILFVGATEIIPRPQEIGLRGAGISFYQRV